VIGYEHTVFATRSGTIVGTGVGRPRSFRVLDNSGLDLTPEPRVDLGTAFSVLAQTSSARSGQGWHQPPPAQAAPIR
jgi:hypothetical protein